MACLSEIRRMPGEARPGHPKAPNLPVSGAVSSRRCTIGWLLVPGTLAVGQIRRRGAKFGDERASTFLSVFQRPFRGANGQGCGVRSPWSGFRGWEPLATRREEDEARLDGVTESTQPRVMRRPWIVGVSGASGTPYAASVIRGLLAAGEQVDLVVSRASRLTLLDETGHAFRDAHWRADLRRWLQRGADGTPDAFAEELDALGVLNEPEESGSLAASAGAGEGQGEEAVRYWAAGDLAAGPSSGSYPCRGMLIVPASTASVAGVALGLSKDLLQRAASVTLKERRPLVVAVRETPLSGQTLKQLVALDEAGAVVLPASPAFYAGATHIQHLVDFVAGRALDAVGVPHKLYHRWEGELGGAMARESVAGERRTEL